MKAVATPRGVEASVQVAATRDRVVASEHLSPTDPFDCSIAATVAVIGDRWTLLILRDAFRGIRRFDEFQRDLGIARNLLTDRLARLVDSQILERVAYQERPVRYEYRLTRKGIELSPSLVALMRWGDTWMAGAAGPPVVLVHDTCRTPVEQQFHCPACDQPVAPLQLRSVHPHDAFDAVSDLAPVSTPSSSDSSSSSSSFSSSSFSSSSSSLSADSPCDQGSSPQSRSVQSPNSEPPHAHHL